MITSGHRASDQLVYAPGLRTIPTRLQIILKNDGHFHIVVFAGKPLQTGAKAIELRSHLDACPTSIFRIYGQSTSRFVTVMVDGKDEGLARLGSQGFGSFHLDRDYSAHTANGVTSHNGAVMVFTPDGLFGYAALLDCG